eukprot:254238_1
MCDNCLSTYKFHNENICVKCEDNVFSNNDYNQHKFTDDQFQIYIQLIEMGFSVKSSLISSSKYSNIESAIQFITEIEKTEQKHNFDDEKEIKITSHKQSSLVSGHSKKSLQFGGVIVLKQNWMEKKSTYLRVWTKRWCVINGENLLIFETENISDTPAESIQLSTITSIMSGYSSDKTIFSIKTENDWRAAEFRADTVSGVKQWIECINKYRFSSIRMRMFIECNRDIKFNETAQIIIPYNDNCKYSINELINNIMNYVQQKHYPLKFVSKIIKKNSFTLQEINCDDDCKHLEMNITTNFAKKMIQNNGMCLQIDISFDDLKVEQLMVYFELIKQKYQISKKNR